MNKTGGRRTPWAWALGTFFGAGLIKPGPGSWGSAAAALIWFAAAAALPRDNPVLSLVTGMAAMAALAVGIPAATIVESESARQDPGHVVIDEVTGQWIALIHARADLPHLVAAFLFFRIFDIVKPWPARRLENLPAGWGIMLDDVAAGVYALLLMQALQHWL